MLGCELLFPLEQAARVQELVTRSLGGPCPCMDGSRCPLMPERGPAALLREFRESA